MHPPHAAGMQRLIEGRRAWIAFAIAGLVFLALGLLVRYSFLQRFDLAVTKDLQIDQWPPLATIMLGLTEIGSPEVVPLVGLVAALALWRLRLPRGAALVLLSLLSIPIFSVLKLLWHRTRPDAAIVHVAVRTSGTSFPSGHATDSIALYGALAFLAWTHLRGRTRTAVAGFLALLPLGIDLSRVYLGAHWLSDVIGGSALGLLVLIPLLRGYLGGLVTPPASRGPSEA